MDVENVCTCASTLHGHFRNHAPINSGHGAMKYKAFKVDVANWPPRFCKLEMTFKRVKRTETETEPGQRTGGKRRGAETVCLAKDANAERNGSDDDDDDDDDEKVVLAFTDPRRLGRVRLRDGNPLSSPPLSLLAPDPMEESGLGRTAEQAISILGATVAPIKSVLLDQSRLVCGVGNWVADDVLYEACNDFPHPLHFSLTRER